MAPGGIYRRCEEPNHAMSKEGTIPSRSGGFQFQQCRCGSETMCTSVLYLMNAISVLLWIIVLSVMISKNSEMAKELQQLRSTQTALKVNGSNTEKRLAVLHSKQSNQEMKVNESLQKLGDVYSTEKNNVNKIMGEMQADQRKIWAETFKLQNGLYKINASACQMCPEGWMLNRGHCYSFQITSKHWSFAKTSCEAQGAQLVIIDDSEEQAFLTSNTKRKNYWIGLNDIQTENTFVWVDGRTPSYTHWYPWEPNNAGKGEDCAILNFSGWWEDRECGGTTDGWICEKSWNC